ncbi:MAG: alpha-galactosidase, partial [Clostridia bacterium]|nr:alpha-galactosidase [Clostridia bacterium]
MKRTFAVECENEETRVTIRPLAEEGGVSEYRVEVRQKEIAPPQPVRIAWREKMRDMLSVWIPDCGRNHAMGQWFNPTVCRSSFQHGAPVLAVWGKRSRNRMTVALSDPIVSSEIAFWIDDLRQRYEVGFSVTLFAEKTDAFGAWEAILRIDAREIPAIEAIGDVYPFWKREGFAVPVPPAAAEDPLYSSWYNFHQAPEEKALLEEMKIASSLGFRTLILDDGWQFAGPSSGNYAQCGAWEVDGEKFPDFKGFVSAVHALGIRVMVWFAVPFIGVDSPLYEKFRGKYLFTDRGLLQAGILDVRYPEVRRYLLDVYRRFLTEYDI